MNILKVGLNLHYIAQAVSDEDLKKIKPYLDEIEAELIAEIDKEKLNNA